MKKRFVLLSLALALLLPGLAAAEELMFFSELMPMTVKQTDLGVKKGTKFPVYGAPFDDAWRGGKGKASVSTGESFTVWGSAQNREWVLADYAVDRNFRRIGWIQTPEKLKENENLRPVWIDRQMMRVTRDTALTDDPERSRREIRKLRAGETVIGMLQMDRAGTLWIYVQSEQEGRTVWAFADSRDLEEVETVRRDGDRITVAEGVTMLGRSYDESRRLEKDEIWCSGLYLWNDDYEDENWQPAKEISLPSSLRELGTEAIVGGQLEELVFPGSLKKVEGDALYGGWIGRAVLARDYTSDIPGGQYTTIEAWEVEEGNPKYSARDGVLFSADGKTLLNYPNGRKALHYDVPRGTETIGDYAFDDSNMALELQTISLPIGLKKIGAHAFDGCGRLHSMAVPLTVTEMDPSAFSQCVSLERLSLPEGLRAVLNEDWALKEDFSHYTGDNGVTLEAPRAEDW